MKTISVLIWQDTLWRHIKWNCSEIHFPIIINTGNDKKYSRAFSSTFNMSDEEENL